MLVGVLLIANGTESSFDAPHHTTWYWVGWAVLTAGIIAAMLGVVAIGVVMGMETLKAGQTQKPPAVSALED